ncbi:MAG: Na-K-Cl cotransporter [Pirellulaceae bacterium]|nr:MAG: Na-K-Cl cotransporter [Pirellulaceae bacterium]
MSSDRPGARTVRKFGTFGGVFTPCTLTILGVIMFLRLGQVVGQAGLAHALLIVLVAKTITTLTTLSLSSIATNTRLQGGGAYYLISRSLGVEFGGAIGVVFYLAQAVSVAMYVIGFTEALVATVPSLQSHFTAVASLVNLACFLCVYIGAGWTIKVQYGILAVLATSLASFYWGAFQELRLPILYENLHPHYQPGQSIFTMFALFFPAVTGIMAGANMSGDLANPSRAIPRGTLAAVGITGVIYLSLVVVLAAVRPAEELIANPLVMRDVAAVPALIAAGVFAATLSSALGSMMGAPRILQQFARDEILKSLEFFSGGSGPSNEPRRATVLTFAIAQIGVVIGDLNAIAPIITMFFMITYGLLNLATFYEAITKNPSYRPTFRYCNWVTSLLGALGCLVVMLLINWFWAVSCLILIAGLHWYIHNSEVERRWGDLKSGVAFERARKALLRLEDEAFHPKNWRPIVMALSGSGWTRPYIPIYGHWLTSGHGILALAQVVAGEIDVDARRRDRYEAALRKFIEQEELEAFPIVTIHPSLAQGIEALIQCHGIGRLRPNTVLFGWPRDAERAEDFGMFTRIAARTGKSVLAARFLFARDEDGPDSVAEHWIAPKGTIDVWWRGKTNGALMLTLAHLLHQNPEWRGNRIRLLRVVSSAEGQQQVREHLTELATTARIACDQRVIVASASVEETIQAVSSQAAVVLMGFEPPGEGEEIDFFHRMEQLAGNLRAVIFVHSAGDVSLEA